jgi:NADP-dependent 3-hydroxy acid dehydrogenase YdfG
LFIDVKIQVMQLDINNTTSISSFAAAVLSDADRIDVLVNNAGVIHTAMSNGNTRPTTSVAYTTHYLGMRGMHTTHSCTL